MGGRTVAARRKVELAWISLGIGDKFGNRLGRDRWIHQHDIGYAHDARDWRDVANKIEAKFLVERGVDRVGRHYHEKRIAIGARTTASAAILVAAPGRFSMTNGWPSRSESHWPIRRAMMSLPSPAGKPTM